MTCSYRYTQEFTNVTKTSYGMLVDKIEKEGFVDLFYVSKLGDFPSSVQNSAAWIRRQQPTKVVYVMERGDAIGVIKGEL